MRAELTIPPCLSRCLSVWVAMRAAQDTLTINTPGSVVQCQKSLLTVRPNAHGQGDERWGGPRREGGRASSSVQACMLIRWAYLDSDGTVVWRKAALLRVHVSACCFPLGVGSGGGAGKRGDRRARADPLPPLCPRLSSLPSTCIHLATSFWHFSLPGRSLENPYESIFPTNDLSYSWNCDIGTNTTLTFGIKDSNGQVRLLDISTTHMYLR